MDVMSLQDILLVGVPETTLSIFTVMLFLSKKIDFKSESMYIQLILSNVVILSVIFLARSHLNSISYISIFSTSINMLTLKYIWQYNWRQSILGGGLSAYLLMTLEMVTFPFLMAIINRYDYFVIFENRIVLTLPTRILQLLLLIIIWRLGITLKDNYLMTHKWNKLSLDKKVTISIVLAAIMIGIFLGISYCDLYFKLHILESNNLYPVYLNSLYTGNILMIVAFLLLLFRTIRYEEYRSLLKKTPEEFLKKILENSNHDELRSYSRIFIDELQTARIVQIHKYFEFLKKSYKNLGYRIDENIIEAYFDYTEVMEYLERIVDFLDKDTNMHVLVAKENRKIVFELQINNFSELEFRSLQNHLQQFTRLKKEIILNLGARVGLDFFHDEATCEIVIPM